MSGGGSERSRIRAVLFVNGDKVVVCAVDDMIQPGVEAEHYRNDNPTRKKVD